MFIEDHDYHAMDNTNENVTDNFFSSVGFHGDNESVVNNATTVASINFTGVLSLTDDNHNISGALNLQVIKGTTSLHTATIFDSPASNITSILPSSFNCTLFNDTQCLFAAGHDEKQPYSTATRIVLAITACVICFISLAANLLILVTVTFTKRLRTANTAFLINLSLSDLLTGAIVLPMVLTAVISSDPENMFAQTACSALGIITNILSKVSILTVAAIAFDRHQAIINCLEYSTMYSTSYIIKGIIWIWIQSIGFSLPPVFGWSEYTYQRRSFMCTINWTLDLPYTLLVFLFCLIMPICVMSYCYIRIIQIARRHMRRIADINTQIYRGEMINNIDPRSALAMAMVDPIQKLSLFPQLAPEISVSKPTPSGQVHGGGNGSRENQMEGDGDNISSASVTNYLGPNLKREARATMRLIGLILMVAVTWLPYFLTVSKDAISYRMDKVVTAGTSVTVTTWMFLLSSAANPIVYALGSRKFRNAVRRLWRKRKLIRQKTFLTQTKAQDASQNVAPFHHSASRLMRSKSVPIGSNHTEQQTETEVDTVPRNNIPPVIILTPLEEVTTPKMSLSSGMSTTEFKFDPVNRLSPMGFGPGPSRINRTSRRLPPLRGRQKVQKSNNDIEMVEISRSSSNPLPCLNLIRNGALDQAARRSSSPE